LKSCVEEGVGGLVGLGGLVVGEEKIEGFILTL
jgi:hypothetical protein